MAGWQSLMQPSKHTYAGARVSLFMLFMPLSVGWLCGEEESAASGGQLLMERS